MIHTNSTHKIRGTIAKLLSFFIYFLALPLFAQQNKNSGEHSRTIDSLNTLLKTATHDTTRASILVALTEELYASNRDTVIPLCKKAIAIIEKNVAKTNIREKHSFLLTKASALNNIGFVYNNQGQIKKALDYHGRSLKIQEEIGDKQGIAISLNNIGMIYNYQGQVKEALDYHGRSLKIQEEIGDKQGFATSLNNIGFIYNNQGQVKEALDYYGRCLKIQEEIGDKHGIANSLNNIGAIYNNQGQVKEALEYYGRSSKLKEEIGDKQGIAISLNNIGMIYNNQGQVKEALDYFGRSLKIKEEIGDKHGIALSLNNIGMIYKNQGQVKEAFDYFGRSLKIQEEIRDKQGIANSLNNIGLIYKNQGQVKEALDYYSRSLKIQEEIGDKQGIAYSLNNIGIIYNNQGQVKEIHSVKRDSLFNWALGYYGKSLKLWEEIGDKQGIAYSLNNIGGIYLQQKNYPLALSYTDSSLSFAKEIGYPENIRNSELLLAKIDSARGELAGAYEHYKLYIVYRDSIKNKENEKAAIRQQTKYEFEKMLLVKEQEERERSRQAAVAVGRRNKLQYSVILIVVVALLSSLLLLGKIKVSHKIAEGIVFFVFLIFFEFILVLADPYIESVTGGAPGFKLLFNAIIAAAIFPVHAYIERWVKKRMIKKERQLSS